MDRPRSSLVSDSSEESEACGQTTREALSEDSDEAGNEAGDDSWCNITQLIQDASQELSLGEMVHVQDFSLQAAMSAIELMEPKMDINCGPRRDVQNAVLPKSLSDKELVSIMDQLLACFATWLNAHTLPQTVFSCAYTQRQEDIPRPELSAYIKTQLATMGIVRSIISTEQVSDEEDFILYNFGFALPTLTEPTVAKVISDAWQSSANPGTYSSVLKAASTGSQCSDIACRLIFVQIFHSVVSRIASPYHRQMSQCEPLIDLALVSLNQIKETAATSVDDVVRNVFDVTINRHLLANIPPRTAPLLSPQGACDYLSRLLCEFRDLLHVRERILPQGGADSALRDRYSLLCLIHGVSNLCSGGSLCVVTRSLLKRILLPSLRESSVFSIKGASLSEMVLADIGLTEELAPSRIRKQANELAIYATRAILPFCRNRGRQRRYLLQALASWDDAIISIFWNHTVEKSETDCASRLYSQQVYGSVDETCETLGHNMEVKDGNANNTNVQRSEPSDMSSMFCDQSPVQILAYQVTCRLMTQHWLLGFECNLYRPCEFAPIFFYVGYVLTTATNATNFLESAKVVSRERHSCRYILHLMDEGRMWMCRAMFSLLHGLTLGCSWKYSWRRPLWDATSDLISESCSKNPSDERSSLAQEVPRESEQHWYEQRFGMMAQLKAGPPFVGYETFLSLLEMRHQMLREQSREVQDDVVLLLADADAGFKMACKAFRQALNFSKLCSWKAMEHELRALARVAVANSVSIVQLQDTHSNTARAPRSIETTPADISFDFKNHRHFPVLTAEPRK